MIYNSSTYRAGNYIDLHGCCGWSNCNCSHSPCCCPPEFNCSCPNCQQNCGFPPCQSPCFCPPPYNHCQPNCNCPSCLPCMQCPPMHCHSNYGGCGCVNFSIPCGAIYFLAGYMISRRCD